VFYTNRTALLLNGKILNLSYGAAAPGAPDVFIVDAQLRELWSTPQRYYLVASESQLPRLERLVGREKLNIVAESGGKFVVTNIPLANSTLPRDEVRSERVPDHHVHAQLASSYQVQRWLSVLPVRHVQVGLIISGFINTAVARQARYNVSVNTLLSSGNVPNFVSRYRVMPAIRGSESDGNHVLDTSLHVRPKENA
jgi:hypothetical protein